MQMPENSRHREDEALNAPPELVSALKRASKEPLFIPPTLDERILREAERHLQRQSKSRFAWPIIFRWAAAVAALVLLLGVIPRFFPKPSLAPRSIFVRADVNHDGQVDILDAFALARALKTGAPLNPQLDVNGDGVVDERDVASVAARAVSLEKGGRS